MCLANLIFQEKKPLYGLPAVLQNPQATVWITEGEWCADHLVKPGVIAMTSGSADSAAAADWSPLQNRRVIIWPDNDSAGFRYAQAVTEQLHKLNCSIQWVNLSALKLPVKGDCVDWLSAHPQATQHDLENLPLQDSPQDLKFDQPNAISSKKASTVNSGPFVVNNHGVFYDDDTEQCWICSRLEVKALVRDKASENWGRLLELIDADGQLHRWAMPMEMLKGSGEKLRGELLRLGLQIAPSGKARQRLVEYITTAEPKTRARCVTKIGWHQNVFFNSNPILN